MTDISSITATERTVDIKHPATREPIGLKITLLPESDPAVAAARRKFLNERLQRGKKVTAEMIESQQTNLIAAAVKGWEWSGDATFHGEKPDFNDAILRKLLKELSWVRSQLDEELGDDAAFFQN